MKEITLALGGGGVKGFAHIGVLKVLEKEGYQIRALAGTSAGGLVGVLYAVGYSPDEIETEFVNADQNHFYSRLPGDGPSMMGLRGVAEALQQVLGDRTFHDTRIPFAVTAVNLDTAELLALRRGKLIDAVLATIAVPGVFPPRLWENQRLVDGGVLSPVPVSLAKSLAPGSASVGVVLSPRLEEWVTPTPPRLLESMPFLSRYLGKMRIAQALKIMIRSMDIASSQLTEICLMVDTPDVIIRPEVPHIGYMDRVNVKEIVQIGMNGAIQSLPELEQSVAWRKRISRSLFQRKDSKFPMKMENE